MKKNLLLLALLALTTGLLAQNNAPQAAPAPVDPAKLALAREAIAAMHADKMFDGMAVQMKQMATQMAGLPSASATPEQQKKFAEMQGRIMDLSLDAARGLVAKMDQIYADVFSEAELKAFTAFYSSPEGQSMLAKQPQVMAHLMPLIQEMQRGLMPKIKQLVDEAKAEAAKPAEAPAAK